MKKPFWLSHQRCGLIIFFENHRDFELIAWATEQPPIDFEEAAKDFIDNLEEYECLSFLEAVRNECIARIDKWNLRRENEQ